MATKKPQEVSWPERIAAMSACAGIPLMGFGGWMLSYAESQGDRAHLQMPAAILMGVGALLGVGGFFAFAALRLFR